MLCPSALLSCVDFILGQALPRSRPRLTAPLLASADVSFCAGSPAGPQLVTVAGRAEGSRWPGLSHVPIVELG